MWIQGLLPETNSLVSVHQREYRVFFLQASATLVCIRALTCLGLMTNRQDGDQHNNNINNTVLIRANFLKLREELDS